MDSFLLKGDTFRGRKEYVGKFALSEWQLTECRKRAVRKNTCRTELALTQLMSIRGRVSVYIRLQLESTGGNPSLDLSFVRLPALRNSADPRDP